MQVTETLKDGLRRGYTITVTAAELEAKVQEKLAEAQPEAEMKGFRKGKVPLLLLRKRFGDRLLGDAMQESIDGAMRKHFESSGDRPALQPEVKMADGESWAEGQDVVVDMRYETLPEIPGVDLAGITLERMVVKAGEEAIDEALANLASSAGTFEARRKGSNAKDGDQVVIDYRGTIDGEAFEGGTAEDHPLVLGSGSFIPGFEEQLVGAKAGEEREVRVTFPENYGAKELAGKEAIFACTVKEVKKPQPTAIDDELAKKFGSDDLVALRQQVSDRLEAEYKGIARTLLKRALLDRLDGMVSFELPPGLVDTEAGQIAHQLWHDENPHDHGHGHGEIAPSDDHRRLAERRVRLGLLLAEIGRNAEIVVTDAELTQAALATARQYRGQERAYLEFVQKNPQAQQQLRAPIFEEKVVDHVLGLAGVTDHEVDREELRKAYEALDEEG